MKIYEAVKRVVENTAEKILKEGAGAVTPGNNGPYYNVETNVRNMAHWCVTFSEYYIHTKEERYHKLLLILADAIMNSPEYNGKGVYKCREIKSSDEVNGVIGPAWIIEGLVAAYRALGDEKYYYRALEIFKALPFNSGLRLWNRRNMQNKELGVDVTFNHQLWIAAAGALINSCKKDDEIQEYLCRFIDALPRNCTIRACGRVAHFTASDTHGFISEIGRRVRDAKSDLSEKMGRASMAYKECGYHSFNLYGFGILCNNWKESIPFVKTKKFKKTLEYIFKNESYVNRLSSAELSLDETNISTKLKVDFNVFAFAYNSPAFELPLIMRTFGIEDKKEIFEALCDKQLGFTYDEKQESFCKNTDDAITLNARVYELISGNEKYFAYIKQNGTKINGI